jgi:hypothetical protein
MRARVATIIADHAQCRRLPLLADLPAGETDTLRHYMKQLGGSPAEAFEAQLLVWLALTFGVTPVFASGTKTGYWTFVHGGERVALSVIGAGKNTPSGQPRDWRLRIEVAPPAHFIERMKQEFTADNPVARKMTSGVMRVQFSARGLRAGGSLARALTECAGSSVAPPAAVPRARAGGEPLHR